MMSALLMLFVLGILGVVMLGVMFALVGAVLSLAFGIAGFLLFKVAPIVLIGYLVLKVFQRTRPAPQSISSADQRWLDGEP